MARMTLDLKEKGTLTELFGENAHNALLREKDKEFEFKRYNYGTKGEAESIGVIPSLNNIEHRNPNKILEEKKRTERAFQNLYLQQVLAETQARMTEIFEQLEDLQRNIAKGTDLVRKRDADNARVFLMDEYGTDTDGMTDDEVLDAVADSVAKDIETQDDLLRELGELAQKFEDPRLSTPGQGQVPLPEYLKRLDELKKVADEHKLNFDAARENVRTGMSINNEILGTANEQYNEKTDDVVPVSANPFLKPPGI